MPHYWSQQLLPQRLIQKLRTRRRRQERARRSHRRKGLAESLEPRRLLAVVAFDETISGDLGDTPSAAVFTLDSTGTNVWTGTIESPGDLTDSFQLDLAPGTSVTDIRLAYTDANEATDPDQDVRFNGTPLFEHSVSGSENVAAGSFSGLNPTLPVLNAQFVNEFLAEVIIDATDVIPAGTWTIEIDTTDTNLAPQFVTTAAVSTPENDLSVVDLEATDDDDAEMSGLTYSIVGGDDASFFQIDMSTGQLDFVAAPDFEMPGDLDVDNVYQVDVQVTDSSMASDLLMLSVTVDDINEPPTAAAGGPYAIDAGVALVLDASQSSDPDAGDVLTFGWDLNGDGTDDVVTGDAITTVPWLTVIDLMQIGSQSIDLTVTDAGGLESTSAASVDISDRFVYSPESDLADDAYTIRVESGDVRVVNTADDVLLSRVPLAPIARIDVLGGDDADSLTIDFAGGPFGVPIDFDGGLPGPPSSGDLLRLVGGSADTVVHEFDSAASGSISIELSGQTEAISYDGLEPIIDNLDAVNRVFQFNGGSESIVLRDNDVMVDDNLQFIDSTLGESVAFLSPTGSLTVNAGSGEDTIVVEALDPLAVFAQLDVNGNEADDTITLNALAATVTANLAGGDGNDVINLGVDSLDGLEGTINLNGNANEIAPTINSTVLVKTEGVAQSVIVGDTLNLNEQSNVVGETYTLTDTTFARASLTASITYFGIESILLQGGSGNDTVEITDTPEFSQTTVRSEAGEDTIRVADTGTASLLTIDAGASADTIEISNTGAGVIPGTDDGSITSVLAGEGEDDITILATGILSGLTVAGGDDSDLLTIADTGLQALVRAELGDGADIVNVRRTGDQSLTDLFGGDSTDTFNVSSDAAGTRAVPSSPMNGVLDGLLGEICVYGEAPGVEAGISQSVTAKTRTVTQSYVAGDVLNVSDRGSLVGHTYTLDPGSLSRTGLSGTITFETTETLLLETGDFVDEVLINSTADETQTTVRTFAGNDSVTVTTSGVASVLTIDTGEDDDLVDVSNTGAGVVPATDDGSVTRVITGAGDDDINLASTGIGSGVAIESGSGVDVLNLLGNGDRSVVRAEMGSESDIVNVQATATDSVTDLFGGEGIDTFNISSDATGTRGAPDTPLSGDLDGLLGDVCVFGEAPGSTPGAFSETVTAKGIMVTQSFDLGDSLHVSDENSVSDQTYSLDSDSLSRLNLTGVLTYATIETLTFESGGGFDTLTVDSTADRTRTFIDTLDGNDTVMIENTGTESFLSVRTGIGSDSVTVNGTGAGEVPGTDQGSVTRILTGDDDDDVTVSGTGVLSGLAVETEAGVDVVTIGGTGAQSAVTVELGLGNDVANVRGTGLDSATDLFGGDGTDTFNVSSDASGDRMDPNPALGGVLDNLLGEICVFGELPGPVAGASESVEAKGRTISQSYDLGDQLNISDEGNSGSTAFSLSASVLSRDGLTGTIAYETIETLTVETGTGANAVTITSTADNVRTTVDTLDGNDTVVIEDTGVESILILNTGLGDDALTISDTGEGAIPGTDDGSVTRVSLGSGEDDVTIESTGVLSGLAVDAGDDDDLVTLIGNGGQSVVSILLGTGDDIANVRSTETDSVTDLFGGDGLDTFNVSSLADGDRSQPNNTTPGNLDGLLGDLCVFGESNDSAPMDSDSVTVKGNTVTVSYSTFDSLNINDASSNAGHLYSLDSNLFERDGLAGSVIYETIELLSIETGSGDDQLTVTNTADSTRTTISTGEGADTVDVTSTGLTSSVLIGTGDQEDVVSIQSTGEASMTRVETSRGNDDINLVSTGDGSGVSIDAGEDIDVLGLFSTGLGSVVLAEMGLGNDIANVRSITSGAAADIGGGEGNDTFNVSSDASGNRFDAANNPSGNLDGLVGDLCIRGGAQIPGNDSEVIRARETLGGEQIVSQDVETGDTLNTSDESSVAAHSYSINATSLQRSGGGQIVYELIESLNVEAGQGASDVAVDSTAVATALRLDTFAGDDSVLLSNTGADSISRVFTGTDSDTVTLVSTGIASATVIDSGDESDTLSVQSVGDRAGVRALTQGGSDTITLEEETAPPNRTGNAVLDLRAGSGADEFQVNEVFLRTVVDLQGEDNDDTFRLTSQQADASGNLVNLNHDPSGSEVLASTRQLLLDGGGNDLGSNSVVEGVDVISDDVANQGSVDNVATGDQVFVDVANSTNPLDLRLAITASSQAVLATTTPASDPANRSDTGNEVFESVGIENTEIVGSQVADFFTVSSDVAFGIGSTGQLVGFDGGDGDDQFELIGTDQDDLVTVGELGGDLEPFEVAGVEEIRVDGGVGSDQISVQTGARTALNGEDGNDDILGGSGTDLLTGGPGRDRLFGGDGNDVILTDRTIGSNEDLLVDNEVLNGGSQDNLSPGDVCLQVGLDQIRNCETVVDGGGIKDVLTWLRGIFISAEEAQVAIDDFETLNQAPQPLVSVTEPSQLPSVAPSGNQGGGGVPRVNRLDVNRSGAVTSLDALMVINYLSRMPRSSGEQTGFEIDGLKDVNGNGTVEPLDALIVINFLARNQSSSGEGEQVWGEFVDNAFADDSDDDEWLTDALLF
ncbi:MAG: dockerin type I domain-containing protein [Planctomycetota bacterium]